jgi:hypothetical protein
LTPVELSAVVGLLTEVELCFELLTELVGFAAWSALAGLAGAAAAGAGAAAGAVAGAWVV